MRASHYIGPPIVMRTSVQWFLPRNGWFVSSAPVISDARSGNTIMPYPEVPASESAVRRRFALPSSAVPKRWTRSVQTALVHVMSLAHYALVQTLLGLGVAQALVAELALVEE